MTVKYANKLKQTINLYIVIVSKLIKTMVYTRNDQ